MIDNNNLDDDDMAMVGGSNPLLMTSMVGGLSQHNETTMFDEDFPSGFINDIQDSTPNLQPQVCDGEHQFENKQEADHLMFTDEY